MPQGACVKTLCLKRILINNQTIVEKDKITRGTSSFELGEYKHDRRPPRPRRARNHGRRICVCDPATRAAEDNMSVTPVVNPKHNTLRANKTRPLLVTVAAQCRRHLTQ